MKSVEGVCFLCWEYSHAYRSADRRVGEIAAPVWLGTPIMCVCLACSRMCLVVREMRMGHSVGGSLCQDRFLRVLCHTSLVLVFLGVFAGIWMCGVEVCVFLGGGGVVLGWV